MLSSVASRSSVPTPTRQKRAAHRWQTGLAADDQDGLIDRGYRVHALEEALQRFGPPQIFNTDQGARFTSEAFTDVLKGHGVQISMDRKGRWVDNVFVERLWRSVKYENVYLHAYETPAALRAGLAQYFAFCNTRRRHSALDRRTPDTVYFEQAAGKLAA